MGTSTQIPARNAMVRKRVPMLIGSGLIAMVVAACATAQQSTPSVSPAPAPVSAAPASAVVAAPDPASIPAPDVDEPAAVGTTRRTMMVAGGCFWGVQGLFQHIKGVDAAESGYAGGAQETADYEAVSTGRTGHTETVRITYDPNQVTFGQLLRVFFAVVEDDAHVTKQVPDTETQYRTAIFAQDANQKQVAESYIAQLNRASVFPGPIVTAVSPNAPFYPAERYHQDFMYANPTEPYIASSEMPKLAELKQQFPQRFRERPVLMFADNY